MFALKSKILFTLLFWVVVPPYTHFSITKVINSSSTFWMELGDSSKKSRFSSYERVAAISLVVLAVASPLYIDHRPESELEDEEQSLSFAFWLPLLLFVLIIAIALSAFLDRNFTRFDRHWIHRVGGSSGGIVLILVVLFLVLKCKASV